MEVNQERIMETIGRIAEFNDTPGDGITRFSYGEQDRKAKAYLTGIFEDMGMQVAVDAVGNIRARYEGTDSSLAPLWVGSHVDSVRNGGRYDGIVGVTGAVEAVRVMHENGYRPRRPVEVVIFAEEEGSNFGTTMVGSKVMIGKYGINELNRLKTPEGKTAFDTMKDFGLEPEKWETAVIRPGDVYGMLELHIEQAIVLEQKGLRLGVVKAIAGMRTLTITVKGVSNHAGATPMDMRQDPMAAAAKLIAAAQKFAVKDAFPTTVATVGQIFCSPNMPNVIPVEVNFTVDIRDITQEGIDTVTELIKKEAEAVEKEDHVTVTIGLIGESSPIKLSDRVTGIVEEAVKETGAPYQCMNSGAVHDAAMLAEITEVGMIFIPSHDGKSHTPTEFTEPEDIKLGAQVLLGTVLRLTE